MNIKPESIVVWKGNGTQGAGTISTRSNLIKEMPYTYNSRVKGVDGTNPEEMFASAHAGCFTMMLAFLLEGAGFTPDELHTTCSLILDNKVIATSKLSVEGKVPNISEEQFKELVEKAGENCPISNAIKAKISVQGSLK